MNRLSKSLATIVLIGAIGLPLAGCSAESATSDDAGTTVSTGPSAEEVRQQAADRRSLRNLREFLDIYRGWEAETSGAVNEFGEGEWADNVKGITVDYGSATIQTNIYPDNDAEFEMQRFGERICGAFSTADEDVTVVEVLDSTGGTLDSCPGVGSI